eukprot:TRINITY_DN1622_c0_g1_i1.p1 TRINITY_DN1622_c0_g1~~TRINITY_DN1622_c0_g1_i1.p1  ORF type:complete len:489 (-),score=202.78 TRINITY_DN1622_c0_g1_i1:266-1642(-)
MESRSYNRIRVLCSHLSPNIVSAHSLRVQEVSAPERKLRTCVLVDGARTPFVKSFGELAECDSIDLGVAAVRGLLAKTKLDPNLIDEVIMGNVVLKSSAPNLAREIVIDLNLPRKVPGVTVSRACLSGLQAIEQGVMLVETGNADVVVAGGSDSLSSGELPMPRKLTLALGHYQMGGGNKKGWNGVKKLLQDAGPVSQWMPKPNSISERSTGKTMGYHADLMAEINKIPRNEQDEFAIASHTKAHKATASGKFKNEVVPVTNPKGKVVSKDNLIRGNMEPSKVAKLPAVFRKNGTVTAASSSALTDGASAVLLMSEEKAKALGYPTDIVVRSFATTAIEPFPQLLMAPAIAIPKALERAGLTLNDIDIFELHEAFAAQVLSTLKVLEQQGLGTVPKEKINPNGGSIAIGHPFAATGGRLATTAANELRRTGKKFALISICAAGGLGGVMILERRDVKP